MTKPLSLLRDALIILLLTAVLIMALEWGASMWLAHTRTASKINQPVIERKHTRYDPDLGWINIPDFYSPDVYGSGVYMKTNSRSFRNSEEVDPEVPNGVKRIVCSGDSFTLGVGVSNDEAWCNFLPNLLADVQTVNMGQGGYGLDQAYLWYMRDGRKLDHDIQVFSIITDDFYRMLSSDFMGYGKPVLRLDDRGALEPVNVPVPTRSYVSSWATRRMGPLRNLALFRVVQDYFSRRARKSSRRLAGGDYRMLATAIFRDLAAVNQAKGSLLLVIYLPIEEDYDGDASEGERSFVRAELAEQQIGFLDLVEEIRRLSKDEVSGFYLQGIGAGHFTRKGNRWVAREVARRLAGMGGGVRRREEAVAEPVWAVEYFDNPELRGPPVQRSVEPAIDHEWGVSSPGAGVPGDHFSARWRSCLEVEEAESLRLFLASDDGSRIYIDGRLVLDHWSPHGYEAKSASYVLSPGSHTITVEYFEATLDASVDLKGAVGDAVPELLDQEYLYLPSGDEIDGCSLASGVAAAEESS